MKFRSFRAILLYVFLIGLFLLSGVWMVKASSSSSTKHPAHNFQPNGHGIVVPQVTNTFTLPKAQTIASSNESSQPDTLSIAKSLPPHQRPSSPSNVVNVPAATTTDSHAKPGISQMGGKPDANGTGGIDNYLETVNGNLAIYGRGGTLQQSSTVSAWLHISSNFYDPVTTWDNVGNRFIFSTLQSSAKKIWVSVAQQA
ncbi:MAG TPA: hypothetical protein DHW02_14625, partial [Ktedonobacter sp.]|nr:hypothetical protein [Ktedonobacter sp.]